MTWATVERPDYTASRRQGEGSVPMRRARSRRRKTVELVLPLHLFAARCMLKGVLAFLHGETDKVGGRLAATSRRAQEVALLVHDTSVPSSQPGRTRSGGVAAEQDVDLSVVCFGNPSIEEHTMPMPRRNTLRIFPNGDLTGVLFKFNANRIGILAGEHLSQNGFTSFAFIGDMRRDDAQQQLRGFQEAVSKRRRNMAKGEISAVGSVRVFDTSRMLAGELEQTQVGDWLAALPTPTGVLGATDIWAYKAAMAATERSIRIPHDAGIVAVGGDPSICESSFPALTSIDLDFTEVGWRLGRAMVAVLEGGCADEFTSQPIEPGPLSLRTSSELHSGAPAYVLEALAYIRERAGDGINVKMVARDIGVSRRKLERSFRRYVGSSPREEIREWRTKKLQQLLEGDMPLCRIARETGFSSAQYMAKFFEAATGTSVNTYRQRRRLENRVENS